MAANASPELSAGRGKARWHGRPSWSRHVRKIGCPSHKCAGVDADSTPCQESSGSMAEFSTKTCRPWVGCGPGVRPTLRRYGRCTELLDLPNLVGAEPEIRPPNYAVHLPGRPHPHNRARHGRMPQRPGDSHFTRGSAVPFADSPQQSGEFQISREQGLVEIGRALAKITGRH